MTSEIRQMDLGELGVIPGNFAVLFPTGILIIIFFFLFLFAFLFFPRALLSHPSESPNGYPSSLWSQELKAELFNRCNRPCSPCSKLFDLHGLWTYGFWSAFRNKLIGQLASWAILFEQKNQSSLQNLSLSLCLISLFPF